MRRLRYALAAASLAMGAGPAALYGQTGSPYRDYYADGGFVGFAAPQDEQEPPPIAAPDFDPREEPPVPQAPEPQPYELADEPFVRVPYAAAEEDEEPLRLFTQGGLLNVYGWANTGTTFNGRRSSGKWNGPVSFNDRRDSFRLHQLYAVMEREIDTSRGWDLGGRVDLLFGSDYVFTQSAGLETRRNFDPRWNSSNSNGLAMPQMYAETGYGDVSVRVGHFYTIIGYEVVTAPDNFFYSHAYTMQYSEPFTHTGFLANWNFNDNWDFVGGLVNGWDKFDAVSNRGAFLGGATYTPDAGDYSLAFAIITGQEDGADLPIQGNRTMYSVVFSADLTENLSYVAHHDYGIQELEAGGTEKWYGLNNYLFYTLTDRVSLGGRAEWYRDQEGSRVAAVRPNNFQAPGGHAGSFYNLTGGLNFFYSPNVTFRPEVRYDWFSGRNAIEAPFDGRNDQLTFGMDAILHW